MDNFMKRVQELMQAKEAKNKEGAKIKKMKYRKKKREEEFYRSNREKKAKKAACKKFSQSKQR